MHIPNDRTTDLQACLTPSRLKEIRQALPDGSVDEALELWIEGSGALTEGALELAIAFRASDLWDLGGAVALAALYRTATAVRYVPALPSSLNSMLSAVRRDFPDDAELQAYAEDRACHALEDGCRAQAGGHAILRLLGGSRCRVDEGWLVVTPGARLELLPLLAKFGDDCTSIFLLRSEVTGGLQEFDAAVAALEPGVRPGLAAATLSLFSRRVGAGPVGFLDAFPPAWRDDILLDRLLGELERRQRLVDGFPAYAPGDQWLAAVEACASPGPRHLRVLLGLEGLEGVSPASLLGTVQAVLARLGQEDRAAVAYGALGLLRLARLSREQGRRVEDSDREAASPGCPTAKRYSQSGGPGTTCRWSATVT